MKAWLKNYWDSFSFVGLTFAILFFSASVTPSLLPRNYLVQGILSGFALAIGYGVGVASLAIYQFLELRQANARVQRIAKPATAAIVAVVFVLFVWRMTFWQNSIRELMGMEPLETAYPYRTAAIAVVWGAGLVALSRCLASSCRWIAGKLSRYLPRRIAGAFAFTLVGFAVFFVSNDVLAARLLNAADRFFLNVDELSDVEMPRPDDPLVSGSEQSLVHWDTIGLQGKDFLTTGPTGDEIGELLGRDASKPLRVYVGMRSAPTEQERARLAVEELKRVGGFDRTVLVVATPTGTGWLDPSAVDTLEYLHAGDTAIVSMQYSYLPSWITILVDPQKSIRTARTLFDEVYAHWKTLPATSRPRLYLHGLSLGSLGSEMSADLMTIFEDPIDGAVWSGPPFPSTRWRYTVDSRNEGTPVWMPTFRDGRLLRFTAQQNRLEPERPWGPIRNVYIQYASDPMVWFSPDLAVRRPEWLNGTRGPDVSPELRWYPIVTFLQIAFDLPMATTVPIGHGHNYAPSSYIDAWIAVTEPADWDEQQTRRLKTTFAAKDTPKP